MFVDPGTILKLFRDPFGGNISEVYNSKLAQAHITAENRLTFSEVIELLFKTFINSRLILSLRETSFNKFSVKDWILFISSLRIECFT